MSRLILCFSLLISLIISPLTFANNNAIVIKEKTTTTTTTLKLKDNTPKKGNKSKNTTPVPQQNSTRP